MKNKGLFIVFFLFIISLFYYNKTNKITITQSYKIKTKITIEPIQSCIGKKCMIEFSDKSGHFYKISFPSGGLFLDKIDKHPDMNLYLTYYSITLSNNKKKKCMTIFANDSYSFFYSTHIYKNGYEFKHCKKIY